MITSTELRQRFVYNFDGLLRITGHGRKDFAEIAGVSYRLIRRVVTKGVSRLDIRNEEALTRVSTYFALPNVKSLWREDLVESLLATNEGNAFVEKFRSQLERRLRQLNDRPIDEEHLTLLQTALKEEPKLECKPVSYLDKSRAILNSDDSKAEVFRVLIDLFYKEMEDGHS